MISLGVCIFSILFGFILFKYPPENINSTYGYRTPFAMKNQDTWNVSQKCGGISMMLFGCINGILGIWAIIQPLGINNGKVQLLFLLTGAVVMIVIDEIYLRKLFNKDGSKKNRY
ncbi:SdpI family protein [Clostridium sp. HV4-5-A1G]|uniref:SdpI family protein n=1 Tax=Clostridium sp. HV4-5-A1G TaxID=2004595 RepID=UPI00123B4067|nr:SdpI family protein [Clostridium sp. HV4-5-A1G]KAA8673306.1 SdpI family protein [Clostridium sp. HV4-5-A1G]